MNGTFDFKLELIGTSGSPQWRICIFRCIASLGSLGLELAALLVSGLVDLTPYLQII